MKRKIKHGFLGALHCFILSLPIIFILVMISVNVLSGFTAVAIDGVASHSINYSSVLDLENIFDTFMTTYQVPFSVVNYNFMSVFNITSTQSYILWINWYMNYLLNMELVLFLPEVLLMFISIARNLVLRWDSKLRGE